jgi:hypothetical protein
MDDPKWYVSDSNGVYKLVAHFNGADWAAAVYVIAAITKDLLPRLGKTIRLSRRGFESKPDIEVSTQAILDEVNR